MQHPNDADGESRKRKRPSLRSVVSAAHLSHAAMTAMQLARQRGGISLEVAVKTPLPSQANATSTSDTPQVPQRPDFKRAGASCSHIGPAREWFAKYDRDGNGKLDYAEYRDLLKSIGTGHDKMHPKYVY